MAAQSQQYPPWLTPLPTVVTDSAGVLTTSTTVLYLPLTYYGPSIPLDPDWTYGGLTSPASTPVPTTSIPTSESAPVTTTPAIPPSSTPIPTSSTSITTPSSSTSSSSTATPSSSTSTSVSLSSSFTSSTSASSTAPLSTPTSSSTPVPAASHHLSKGQLIGVIVASILGAIFIFILVLSLYLFCKGRKKRQREVSFSMVAPIDEDYLVVGEEGRILGEGSPRHSGEEADPFLQRTQDGATAAPEADTEIGARPDSTQVPGAPSGSLSSNGTSSTNHSGYGVLIDRPTLNLLPATAEELDQLRQGHILSPEELRHINEETVLPPPDPKDGRYAPLPPPPRLVDPEHAQQTLPLERPPFKPQASHLSQMSTIPDADEPVTVAMARRVRVENLASRSPPQLPLTLSDASSSSNTGFLSGLGAGLANIGRLSWLKNSESSSRRISRTHSYLAKPHEDIEAGKSLLHPQMSQPTPSQWISFGKNSDAARPISASSVSGGSVYHDAYSSLPGTPISGTAKLAPLPRALTPSTPATPDRGWPSKSTITSQTPSYDFLETSATSASTSALFNHGLPSGQDILDMPAPSAVLPFTSASTSTLSLREKITTSSLVLKTHPFPPGLALGAQKKSWTDASSSATQVYTPFTVVATHDNRPTVAIDVLEDAPPSAEEGWRSMAAVIQSGPGRRTTFGVYSPDIMSEQGSLYSNHSHIASLRSSGSAPISRRDQSYSTGSASSRPSAFSTTRTIGSGHSAAASRSISSNERKRAQPVSPALSAFGPPHGEPESSVPLEPPTAYFNDGTVRSTGSGSTAVDTLASVELVTTTATEPPGSPSSPLIQFSNAPWAAGLDQDWNPTET